MDKRTKIAECKICSDMFDIKSHNQIYCSKKCQTSGTLNNAKRVRRENMPIKKCILCDVEFSSLNSRLCSDECKKKSKHIASRKYYERVVIPTLPGPVTKKTKEERDKDKYIYNRTPETRKRMREYRNDPKNKEKILEQTREYKKRNPDIARNGHLKRKYGITLECYNSMLKEQNNVCYICNKPETSKDRNGNTKPLAVDHCHATGEVRKLLCFACNSTLGKVNESIDILESLVDYIKEHKE